MRELRPRHHFTVRKKRIRIVRSLRARKHSQIRGGSVEPSATSGERRTRELTGVGLFGLLPASAALRAYLRAPRREVLPTPTAGSACPRRRMKWSARVDGGGKETRTPDPHAASVMLYQLSYAPATRPYSRRQTRLLRALRAVRRRPSRVRTRTNESAAPLGDVAQLVEHLLCKQGVRGSNPRISTL